MATSWITWAVVVALSVAAALLGVWSGRPEVLALVMSIVAVAVAGQAIGENWRMAASGADDVTMASANARHMAVVWSLGTLSLLLTYTVFLVWKEWLVFTGAFFAVALLCLGLSAILAKGAGNGNGAGTGTGDDAMLTLARYLMIGQLVGMIATMAGLVIDGKMPASIQANPGWQDWAGNVIFFYGALALAAISANAIYTDRKFS